MGAARGRPGGAPLAWVWGVRGRALSYPRPLVLSGVRPGPTTHWLWVAGVAGVGTRHQPHRARFCELAWRPVGAARGRPGGAPLAWVWGVRGRALSYPRPLVLSGVRPGPTTHWLWVRGMRAWGPVTNPAGRALACWLGALRGRQEGARGGASCLSVGRPGSGALPPQTTRPFGRAARGPLPTGCGCGRCGNGDPSPTPQRALLRAGFARCGGGMKVPWGAASFLGVGRPGSGALPPRTTRPFRRAAAAHYPLAVGAGAAGVETRHQPNSASSCVLAWRAVGATRGRPGGAPLAWVRGVRGEALSHPRPLVLSGVRPGPTTHWLWVRGLRVWGPVTNPTACAFASWLCALWGRPEGALGGALLAWVWGVRGRVLSDPRPLVLSGLCRGPLPTGCWCGGCGRGDLSPTPQRALLRAGFAR